MRREPLLAFWLLLAIVGVGPAYASTQGGATDDERPVALVNGEPISLEQYMRALGEVHSEPGHEAGAVPSKDPTALLQRLVDIELVLQEAENIGLPELPEFDKVIAAYRRDSLRAALLDRAARSAPPPDSAEIERRYAAKATVLELSSIEFSTRDEAQAFADEVAGGAEFLELARQRVAAKRGTNLLEEGKFRRTEVLPTVAEALDSLEPGGVTPPIPIQHGFAVLQCNGTSLADDAEAREQAAREVRREARTEAARAYLEGLRREYLETDDELVASLDFDSAPEEFDRYLEDERIMIHVKDGEPIRVSDVARMLKNRMFHGIDQAAKNKRLNKSIPNVLEELSTERVIQLEAVRLGLDKTADFEADLEEYRRAVLFGLFVQKVIDPSIVVTPEDLQKYYDTHTSELTEPAMVRLDSLAFSDAATAQHALERLNAGADLNWMRENAEGQADPSTIPEKLRWDPRQLVTVDSLPEGVREAIVGGTTGDYRLYSDGPDRHFVLYAEELVPARTKTLEEARDQIAPQVFAEKRELAMRDWTRQLREASEVEILFDAEGLRNLAMGSAESPAP